MRPMRALFREPVCLCVWTEAETRSPASISRAALVPVLQRSRTGCDRRRAGVRRVRRLNRAVALDALRSSYPSPVSQVAHSGRLTARGESVDRSADHADLGRSRRDHSGLRLYGRFASTAPPRDDGAAALEDEHGRRTTRPRWRRPRRIMCGRYVPPAVAGTRSSRPASYGRGRR
jgi:hypothetical protein